MTTERCYIEVTTVPPKPVVTSKRFWRKKDTVKADAKRISQLARQPIPKTTLKEVPCVKPVNYTANLAPVVPYAWEVQTPFDSSTDWYTQFVGPVPQARVPVPPTLALIGAGLFFILKRRNACSH